MIIRSICSDNVILTRKSAKPIHRPRRSSHLTKIINLLSENQCNSPSMTTSVVKRTTLFEENTPILWKIESIHMRFSRLRYVGYYSLTFSSPTPPPSSAKTPGLSGVWWSAWLAIPPCNLNNAHFGTKNGVIGPKKGHFYIDNRVVLVG
mgnify:CR=1 FL=1